MNKKKQQAIFIIIIVGISIGILEYSKQKNKKIEYHLVPSTKSTIELDQANKPLDLSDTAEKETISTSQSLFSEKKDFQDLRSFLSQKDSKSDWSLRANEKGQLISLSGGFIDLKNESPDRLSLARQIGKLIGIPEDQIKTSPFKIPETKFSKTHIFDQVIDGYTVYGAQIKISERLEDQKAFFVSTDLIPPQQTGFEIRVSQNDAQVKIQNLYNNQIQQIKSVGNKPKIFCISQEDCHLTWEFTFYTQNENSNPKTQPWIAFISALDGEIVFKKLNLVH